MKITSEIIANLRPCSDRFYNFLKHYGTYDGDLQNFVTLDKITYDDKVWVFTRLATPKQNSKWAELIADSAQDIKSDGSIQSSVREAYVSAANNLIATTRFSTYYISHRSTMLVAILSAGEDMSKFDEFEKLQQEKNLTLMLEAL